MPLCYEQNFKALGFECDLWDRMKPGAVLRRVQEIATEQCESLGIDEAFYVRTGTVFLLSRLSLQVARMPQLGEQVRLETRAYGMRKALYHRLTTLYAQNGDMLCETDSRWLLVDRNTHRIMRRPLEEFQPYFSEDPAEEHSMEMPKPANPQKCGQGVASYSVCDRNGHMNNTCYADVVCDALPVERLQQAIPSRILMYYRAEIPFGEAYDLLGEPVGEDSYYYVAVKSGDKKFESFVSF